MGEHHADWDEDYEFDFPEPPAYSFTDFVDEMPKLTELDKRFFFIVFMAFTDDEILHLAHEAREMEKLD